MDTVKYIFGLPDYVDGVGNIYPVKVKYYDDFLIWQQFLNVSESHLSQANLNEIGLGDSGISKDELKLLDFVLIFATQDRRITIYMEKLFSLILQKDVFFVVNEKENGFVADENHMINRDNYSEVRKVIMKQNLLHEPKVFKNKLVQEWAEKTLKARQKNGVKYGIEDVITTVKNYSGITYQEVMEQTIYQVYADFQRINKLKDYDVAVSFKCAGAEKIKIPYFAEELNMFKNPYDDLFVDKSKLKNTNQVFKGGK